MSELSPTFVSYSFPRFLQCLRICDILVRIRIRGYVHLTNGSGFWSGSGSGSCYICWWPKWQLNKKFYTIFCLLLLKLDLNNVSKITIHKKSQNSRNLTIWAWCWMLEQPRKKLEDKLLSMICLRTSSADCFMGAILFSRLAAVEFTWNK